MTPDLNGDIVHPCGNPDACDRIWALSDSLEIALLPAVARNDKSVGWLGLHPERSLSMPGVLPEGRAMEESTIVKGGQE